jgi:phosphomevalonate kinase
MRARAPGKVVISGAYAVLEGAPAIVTAVDRYVTADALRAAELVTPEVRAAIGNLPAPWFDASALRQADRKLGLGSSAAILVASLAAIELAARPAASDEELCISVLSRALDAHARAQGGGSGVDVAASAHGGTLLVRRRGEAIDVTRLALPGELVLEVWAAGSPAATAEMVAQVRKFAAREPATYRTLIDAQARAAERAAKSLEYGEAVELVEALADQRLALGRLGVAAGVPIVSPEVDELCEMARQEGSAVLPAGAGGGDVVLYVGIAAPSPDIAARAQALGHNKLELSLGARGVHAAREET